MHTFNYSFTVNAPLKAVAIFHQDTRTLKKLNPPFVIVQLHRVDPMAEGSISEFTLWMGPLPIRWRAVHSEVSAQGFTDTQEIGPMASWRHTHHFKALNENTTHIHEHLTYEHHSGWHGLLTKILFGRLGLMALFSYRKWITRRALNTGDKS